MSTCVYNTSIQYILKPTIMSYNSDPSNNNGGKSSPLSLQSSKSDNNGNDENDANNTYNNWKITRLTADRVIPDFDPRYNFDDLQGDDVQSINNPYDSETWYECKCKCGVCYECINNYDEVERDDDGEEEYYGDEEEQGYGEYDGEQEYDGEGEDEDEAKDRNALASLNLLWREQKECAIAEATIPSEEEEYLQQLGEGEDVCSCGNICLFEDALCVDCIEQNKYYTLVPRSGWTDVEYTDEGKDLIRNFPRYKERSSADILYYLSQEFCEFYYLYKNKSQAAALQIQVILGRAFTGN